MTISNEVTSYSVAGNGIAVSWSVVVSINTSASVKVKYENSSNILVDLVLDTDFTVTLITASAFTLTLTSFLLASGEYLHIESEEPYTQTVPLPQGAQYPADVLEAMYDKCTRLAQQVKTMTERCLRFAKGRTEDIILELDVVPTAGSYFKVNAAGTALEQVSGVLPDDVTVTAFMETVLAAADADAVRKLLGGGVFVTDTGGRLGTGDALTLDTTGRGGMWSVVGPTGTKERYTAFTDGTGGTFTMGDGTMNTAALSYDVSAADMQTALEGIYGSGNVTVAKWASGSGPYWYITFEAAVTPSTLEWNVSGITGAFGSDLQKSSYVWDELDNVPSDVDWIAVGVNVFCSTSNASTFQSKYLYGRKHGGAVIVTDHENFTIVALGGYPDASNDILLTAHVEVKIPVASMLFDIYDSVTDDITTNTNELTLRGYGYN